MSRPTPLLQVEDLHVRLETARGPADAVRGVGFKLVVDPA